MGCSVALAMGSHYPKRCCGLFSPNNRRELIDYAKARPGQLNYSNPVSGVSHLDMREFLDSADARQGGWHLDVSFINPARETPALTMQRLFADFPERGTRRFYNLTGVPVPVAPMGFDPNGVPMGLQIAGN